MTGRHADALQRTLTALNLPDVHASAMELARAYAAELDGAAGRVARADRLVEQVVERHGRESALYEEVEALRAALSARTALLGIGKAHHALLAELLATPKARPSRKDATSTPTPKVSPLHALRGGAA